MIKKGTKYFILLASLLWISLINAQIPKEIENCTMAGQSNYKLKEINFKNTAKYSTIKYDIYFDSYSIREFANILHLNYDSLDANNIQIQKKTSDTISFNKLFANSNPDALNEFILNLIKRRAVTLRNSVDKKLVEKVIVKYWTLVLTDACTHSGPIAFVNNDYLLHYTSIFSR